MVELDIIWVRKEQHLYFNNVIGQQQFVPDRNVLILTPKRLKF